jgi:predicted ATP-dependent serine protease
MPGKPPADDQLPTSDGGYQTYLAAGQLAGKKALITGGDSGIGRATAVLYAMKGAKSTVVYLPEEEKDAQETARLAQEKGGRPYLITADLRSHQRARTWWGGESGLWAGLTSWY